MEEEKGSAEKIYEEFREKVKRTVYLDDLSPAVTIAVVTTALEQFGTVTSVHFVPHCDGTKNTAQSALVEMDNEKMAKAVVAELTNNPFMMSGMPRPVRGCVALPEMFVDRPEKPNRKIHVQWMQSKDPNFQRQFKALTEKHRAEAELLLKLQKEKEKQLHQVQAAVLRANYQKYDSIDKLWSDGTIYHLGEQFGVNVKNEV